MEQLTEIWQQFVEGEGWEWVFSGIGVPVVGWLLFRWWKKPDSNTYTCNGGEQNFAQGKGAIGRQTNIFLQPLKPRILVLVIVLMAGTGMGTYYLFAPPAKSVSTQGGGTPTTVAGHDATVHYNSGIPPEDFARYAGKLAVTDTALVSFFKILDEQQVSSGDLDSKLREIAGQYKESQTLLKTVGIENLEEVIAEIIKRTAEAGDYAKVIEEVKQAGEAGDDAKVEELLFAMVEDLLNQVEARDVQAIEKLEQAAKQRRISAEKINVFQAILQLGKLHYTNAGYYYRKAVSLVPMENKWKRFAYLSFAGAMLHLSTDN